MIELQQQLAERFGALRDSRQGPVFFIEHGLDSNDLDELHRAVSGSALTHPLDDTWWERNDLPLIVVSTEMGYKYRGSGTDFWPLLAAEIGQSLSALERLKIRELFAKASERFRGARPAKTAWAEAFHLIAWPITHALLPLEFHRPLAKTFASLRSSARDASDDTLYRAVRDAALHPGSRFLALLEDKNIVVPLARALLANDPRDLSVEIVQRLAGDLHEDQVARRSMHVAQRMQHSGLPVLQRGKSTSVQDRITGTLQLRRGDSSMHLEATFPLLDADTAQRLRSSLRRRRFVPSLWGVSSRVPSDQLLSGIPFLLKLGTLPKLGDPIFSDADLATLDAHDVEVLSRFELELRLPQIFAVNVEGDVGHRVAGKVVSSYRKYWVLVPSIEEIPKGGTSISVMGPYRCFEVDATTIDGARLVSQLGYMVRRGVSVSFAGSAPIDRDAETPAFVIGERRLVLPKHPAEDALLTFELDGQPATIGLKEVVQLEVQAGRHRLRVSSETDTREFSYQGVTVVPRIAPPVRLELCSEERTIQALTDGRLNFKVDSHAPLDGLKIAVGLVVGSKQFRVVGDLGTVPQVVNADHPVVRELLRADVRDILATSTKASLQVRVGHLAKAEWELERLVRPCWWDLSGAPKLLSESGPLRFGVVNFGSPLSAPMDGTPVDETYLLAPLELAASDFSSSASFSTFCVAPRRAQIRPLSIVKPRLERRRRGNEGGVGVEELAEAYFRWTLAETQSAIGDFHRRQVATRLEQWLCEACCGSEWLEAERDLPSRDAWGLLEQVLQDSELGRDAYVDIPDNIDIQIPLLAVSEIRKAVPSLWLLVRPNSGLDESDYERFDRAFASAYEQLGRRSLLRGQKELGELLMSADPGEPSEAWSEALTRVSDQIEMRSLAAMLVPSSCASRLISLPIGTMSFDEQVDEVVQWASTAKKSLAGPVPSRDVLRACYALWADPALAVGVDWRSAMDTLLAERGVARATRYMALKARTARWGTT